MLELITGPMFSGKTETLLNRYDRAKYRKKKAILIKPDTDKRYSDTCVVTHNGVKHTAFIIKNNEEILKISEGYDIVCLDEAQFMVNGKMDLLDVVIELQQQEKEVYMAGLTLTFGGIPFESYSKIMPYATKITLLKAVCVCCGEDAVRTYKKTDSKEVVELGSEDIYEARCFSCWLAMEQK
jgi:thymidine kinase